MFVFILVSSQIDQQSYNFSNFSCHSICLPGNLKKYAMSEEWDKFVYFFFSVWDGSKRLYTPTTKTHNWKISCSFHHALIHSQLNNVAGIILSAKMTWTLFQCKEPKARAIDWFILPPLQPRHISSVKCVNAAVRVWLDGKRLLSICK